MQQHCMSVYRGNTGCHTHHGPWVFQNTTAKVRTTSDCCVQEWVSYRGGRDQLPLFILTRPNLCRTTPHPHPPWTGSSVVANKLSQLLISSLFCLPLTIVTDPEDMGTDPEPLSLVWQRGFFFWVCVGVWPSSPRTRLGGREGWWNIKALTIHSFQVLFPSAALRLTSLQHPVTQASLTTVDARCDPPGGANVLLTGEGRNWKGGRGSCVLRLPTITTQCLFMFSHGEGLKRRLGIREVG